MSDKIFHWASTFKTLGEDDDGSVNIKGYASTNASDRAGDSIDHDAWTKNGGLENFKGNPIILFNHDYNRPIGRATSLEVNDKGLELDYEEARKIVYGMPYNDWKSKHQKEASADQVTKFKEANPEH